MHAGRQQHSSTAAQQGRKAGKQRRTASSVSPTLHSLAVAGRCCSHSFAMLRHGCRVLGLRQRARAPGPIVVPLSRVSPRPCARARACCLPQLSAASPARCLLAAGGKNSARRNVPRSARSQCVPVAAASCDSTPLAPATAAVPAVAPSPPPLFTITIDRPCRLAPSHGGASFIFFPFPSTAHTVHGPSTRTGPPPRLPARSSPLTHSWQRFTTPHPQARRRRSRSRRRTSSALSRTPRDPSSRRCTSWRIAAGRSTPRATATA